MLNRYTLFLGLNDKKSKQQEIDTITAYKLAQRIVGDCTIQEGRGVYTHRDGAQVIETTLIIMILDFDGSLNISEIVDKLKVTFNQESIAVVSEAVESKLM